MFNKGDKVAILPKAIEDEKWWFTMHNINIGDTFIVKTSQASNNIVELAWPNQRGYSTLNVFSSWIKFVYSNLQEEYLFSL